MDTYFSSVKFRRLNPLAQLPEYKTPHASGVDLCALLEPGKVLRLYPGKIELIKTGLAVELPMDTEGQVRSRSSMALKGVIVVNQPGTIDEDYRGEIGIILTNIGLHPYDIASGDRVAQLVFAPVHRFPITEAYTLSTTERGDGGFGSTGKA